MRTVILMLLVFFISSVALSQNRKVIYIPDIPGYHTLKCDLHLHTIFSDGTVWPTIRIEEAWQEGLDAIAITDHIEYRPHSKDIQSDHNRSFEIAEPLAHDLNMILIKGAEITRSMPPGHLNALFIRNANLLDREDVKDALQEAREQGAFLIWNHPGWKAQQPDTTLWWKEHTHLLQNDMLHGIEVYNYNEHYAEAFDWAKEKKLAVIASTDLHEPVSMAYDVENAHRPMTLVFSHDRTAAGIREALFSRRTAAWFDNVVVGNTEILRSLFFASVELKVSTGKLRNRVTKKIELVNKSDIAFEMELVQPGIGFDATQMLTAETHKISVINISGNSDEVEHEAELKLYYRIKNMFLDSNNNLIVTLTIPNN